MLIQIGGVHRLFFLFFAFFLTSPAPAQPSEPYDVLFIAVDDQNDWVGYLGGHPQTRTPNIDRLAARGMAFTNAQSPSAICHAVRTAILTELGPSTSGIYGNGPDWRDQAVFRGKSTLPRFSFATTVTRPVAQPRFSTRTRMRRTACAASMTRQPGTRFPRISIVSCPTSSGP